MADLGQAVAALKEALDALDERLADRLADLANHSDAADATRRQAKAARRHAAEASEDLSAAIAGLRRILDDPPSQLKE